MHRCPPDACPSCRAMCAARIMISTHARQSRMGRVPLRTAPIAVMPSQGGPRDPSAQWPAQNRACHAVLRRDLPRRDSPVQSHIAHRRAVEIALRNVPPPRFVVALAYRWHYTCRAVAAVGDRPYHRQFSPHSCMQVGGTMAGRVASVQSSSRANERGLERSHKSAAM